LYAAVSVLAVLLTGCTDERPPLPPEPQLNERLVQAVAANRLTEVEDLIRQGANVNYTRGVDGGGMTSLLFAAREGYVDVARVLVDAGANVNARQGGDVSGKTPLLEAAATNHLEIVALLLQRGAQPNVHYGEPGILPTPLNFAARYGHHECAKLLIMYGATIKRDDLEIAIAEGHPEVLSVLLSGGADPWWRFSQNETVLELAERAPQQARERLITIVKRFRGDPEALKRSPSGAPIR
jgi:ankyrin repeat protein